MLTKSNPMLTSSTHAALLTQATKHAGRTASCACHSYCVGEVSAGAQQGGRWSICGGVLCVVVVLKPDAGLYTGFLSAPMVFLMIAVSGMLAGSGRNPKSGLALGPAPTALKLRKVTVMLRLHCA